MLTTQARLVVDSPRSCWSLAVRVFTMLVSIAIISWASTTTARTRQRRGSPIAEGSTGPPVGTAGAVVALEVGRDDVGMLTPRSGAPRRPIGYERRTAGREHGAGYETKRRTIRGDAGRLHPGAA